MNTSITYIYMQRKFLHFNWKKYKGLNIWKSITY